MLRPAIDPEKCVQCGQCVATCPTMIFRKTDSAIEVDPTLGSACMACGHCMAVCPSEAVTAAGYDYADFGPLPEEVPDADALMRLFVSRRSVRRFTDEPVSREHIERVLEMALTAPVGVPPSPVEVTVFSDGEQIKAILPAIVTQYQELGQAMESPLKRFFLRRAMGSDQFDAIEELFGPLMEPMGKAFHEQGIDWITWDAPAMLLFHATRRDISGKENCLIAATYAALAAHSLGLGATILGCAAPAIEESKKLRAKLGIPEGNDVVISVIVGHPAERFRRTIPRQFKSVNWLD